MCFLRKGGLWHKVVVNNFGTLMLWRFNDHTDFLGRSLLKVFNCSLNLSVLWCGLRIEFFFRKIYNEEVNLFMHNLQILKSFE